MATAHTELAKCLQDAAATYSRWLEKSSRNWKARQPRRSLEMPLLGWLGLELDQHARLSGKSISKRFAILRKALKRHSCIEHLSEADLDSIRLECEGFVGVGIAAFHHRVDNAVSAHGDMPVLAIAALKSRARIAYEMECLGRIYTGVEELRVKAGLADLDPLGAGESSATSEQVVRNAEADTHQDDAVSEERKLLIREFKTLAKKRYGIKVTDEMVASKAKPGHWNDRTMVSWWKRNDSGCKSIHDKLIRKVLKRDPASLWPELVKKVPANPTNRAKR